MYLTAYAISTIYVKLLASIYEADRHAKKELKKQVRGVRAIEQSVGESDSAASVTVP